MEEEKDTSWEEEFDKRFSYLYQHIDSQALQVTQHEAVKQFIRQEREAVEEKVRREFGEHSEAIYSHRREALLKELLDDVKNLESESYPAVFGDEDVVRLSDVQELIEKKI